MLVIYIVTALAVIVSLIFSREKTLKGIVIGAKKLWQITGSFVTVIIGIAIVLYLVPSETISKLLDGSNDVVSVLIATLIGTVTVMPGPVVYPLCGVLVEQGITYPVIAAFSASLMLVGIVTFPMEKEYFGLKFALVRNFIGLFISVAIAVVFFFLQGWL